MKRLIVLGISGLLLAAPAFAVGYSGGYGSGSVTGFGDYDPIIAKYNASGELFIIRGRCQSACTLFLSIRNACLAPNARLGFHAAPGVIGTSRMLNSYNPKLRSHLESVGAMQGPSFTFISARDMTTKFGYRACPRN